MINQDFHFLLFFLILRSRHRPLKTTPIWFFRKILLYRPNSNLSSLGVNNVRPPAWPRGIMEILATRSYSRSKHPKGYVLHVHIKTIGFLVVTTLKFLGRVYVRTILKHHFTMSCPEPKPLTNGCMPTRSRKQVSMQGLKICLTIVNNI